MPNGRGSLLRSLASLSERCPGLDSYLSAMTLARKTAAHAVGLWRSSADAAHVRLFPLVDGMVEDHLGHTPQLMAIGIEGSAR